MGAALPGKNQSIERRKNIESKRTPTSKLYDSSWSHWYLVSATKVSLVKKKETKTDELTPCCLDCSCCRLCFNLLIAMPTEQERKSDGRKAGRSCPRECKKSDLGALFID